ncbi:hypothetical protein ACFSX5_16445 [Devosia albogilva]|uniref:Uncharacterized protein n=1 Tax=Devosia albogilva TaxID=429726 RepID=A0ABW5QP49_9HYPH
MRLAAAAALLLTASFPVLAQGLDPLEDAMAKMPETVLSNPAAVQFNFVDVAALHTLAGAEGLNPTVLTRAMIGGMLPPYNALQLRGPEAWNEKSFVDVEDLRYLAGFGDAPTTITIWGLENEDAAASLISALDAADFDSVSPEGVIGNGEPLAMDPTKMDPADPWRSRVGAATFAAAKGNAVIQATVPAPFGVLLEERPSMAESAVVTAALGGLEAALGDDLLVQAMLITPVFGLGAADLDIALIGLDLDMMREKLEAELEAGTEGIPVYLGGFIADAQGEQPAVLISLTYADCATAERAAEQMAQRWSDTMPTQAQGDMETATIQSPDGLCAATLKVAGTSDAGLRNPVFQALFDAYLRRDFTVVQIGKAS